MGEQVRPMRSSRSRVGPCRRLAFLVLTLVGTIGLAAPDDAKPSSPQDLLKSKGLTREKGSYVLDDESAFFRKREESAETFAKFNQAFDALAASEGNEQQIAELDRQRRMLRTQIGALQIEQGKMFGRVRRGQMAGSPRDIELRLKSQLNQTTSQYNALKSQQLKPRERTELVADYGERRKACLERLDQLQESAAAITKKYNELSRDSSIREALAALSKADKANYKVRASDRFSKAVRELNAYRRNAGATPASPATKKAAAKSKAAAATKNDKSAAK